MISVSNLQAALLALGFTERNGVFQKYFTKVDCMITVDTIIKRIFYPPSIKTDAHMNENFDHNENFVVLECVARLLDKGYRPEHIELEKTWRLGHGASGGRSDICVKHFDSDRTLFIIECKTAGAEYDAALENLKRDGGQLFSYWQQARECKWLSLYASDFVDGAISYTSEAVDCGGSAYRNATNTKSLFRVWSTTYEKKLCGDVVFSDASSAYRINEPTLLKKYLVDFEEKNRIINRFEEILRHNNVSDKENAFNRLTALFISKLADESGKGEDAELEFQYKIGTDDYYSLNDRLLRLYSEGMEKFMREHIDYVPNNAVDLIFEQFPHSNRRLNLAVELNKMVRKLKFFTNNEFAFKEIHNEKLFLQNGKILREMVQLFERYRLIGAKNLQLLGDLFEQLLNHGFKQNEGQFFTPIPIARFIWDCLPLSEHIREDNGKFIYPRVIDYACGAGHFLTQGFEAINDCMRRDFDSEPDPEQVSAKFYGIEKDYRLSRVSKISMFMHGAGAGNIVFGDGLDDYDKFDFGKEILPGRFDILTANPPYAVAAFKPHLAEETQKHFTILDKISDDGSEIETLFVERAEQLLKPLGIAAIILPSSILNKDSGSFIAARDILIKRFKIRAIVRLGSKTFGATGTNTAIFFLQKFHEPLRRDLTVEDCVDAILDWRKEYFQYWEDQSILDAWLAKTGIAFDDYKQFMQRAAGFDRWKDHPYFGAYHAAFVNSNAYIKKIARPSFQKMSETERSEELDLMFYEFARAIEREKLWCYGCTYNQTTLVVTAPDDNKAQETFLGYKWSNRKGAEGMQVIQAGGLLFNPIDRRAEGTIAALVRAAYEDRELEIDALKEYCYYLPTHQMLDFNTLDFNKVLQTTPSIYDAPRLFPTVRLDEVVDINRQTFNPATTPTKEYHYVDIGSINANLIDYSTLVIGNEAPSRARRIAEEGDVIISTVRPYLKAFAVVKDIPPDTLFSTGFAVLSSKDNRILSNEFMYCLFMHDPCMMTQMRAKMGRGLYPSINQNDISGFIILLPPIEVQREIVAAFDDIDALLRAEDRIIRECDEKIDAAYNALVKGVSERITLGECCIIEKGSPLTREQAAGGDVPVVAGGIEPSCYHDRANRPANVITVSASGSAGYIRFWTVPIFATDCNTLVSRDDNAFAIEYIYHAMKRLQDDIYALRKGAVLPHVYARDLRLLSIPLLSFDRQREFSALARELDSARSRSLERRRELQSERDAIINRYFC